MLQVGGAADKAYSKATELNGINKLFQKLFIIIRESFVHERSRIVF
mgnify:CR=1 FL=1|jgi:hypothetical protein